MDSLTRFARNASRKLTIRWRLFTAFKAFRWERPGWEGGGFAKAARPWWRKQRGISTRHGWIAGALETCGSNLPGQAPR